MIRILFSAAILCVASPAVAQDQHDGKHHDAKMDHSAHHDGDMQHDDHHDHDAEHAAHEPSASATTAAAMVRTPDIDAALAAGGQPIVVDVLGAVCDFCTKAMHKTFGKRPEVAAAYVDLDTKTLNLVVKDGAALSDDDITALVKKSGYKSSAIRRGDAALSGAVAK